MSTGITQPPAPPADLSSQALVFSRTAAVLTLVLLTSRVNVGQGVTLGHIAMVLLSPLWFPMLRRYTGGLWLAWTGLLASVSSVWLTAYAASTHETTNANLVQDTLLIAGSVAAIGLLLWAKQILPVWVLGSAYAVGMFLDVFLHQHPIGFNEGSGGEVNVWKFAFALPVGVLSLALAARSRRPWVAAVVLMLLALASARFDSRSYFGEFAVAALLVIWQLLPRTGGRSSALRVVLAFAVIAAVMYNLGTALILGGALGEATQARSIAQVQQSGSIITGGRPEMGATAALFLSRPFGFGGGTIATFHDVDIAKAGMARLNYDPENGYVENFLFGSRFELHSSAADLWVYAGLAGIAFAVLAAVLLLTIVGRGIAARSIHGLVLFCVVQSMWDLFFNPMYSSAPILVLALGLGLNARAAAAPPQTVRDDVVAENPQIGYRESVSTP